MDPVFVPVLSMKIVNHNIITVSVGKTGGGKDTRTVVRIRNSEGTQMWAGVNGQDSVEAEDFTLSFRGSAELETFLAALHFIECQLKAEQLIKVP